MTPPELTRLRERLAEITDLQALGALMFWDQNTMMPPGGAGARADMADTLQRTLHERETDPELGRLLDALEPWAAGEDPDSDAARLVHWARRDYEKSVRVPADLRAEMSRAGSHGMQVWAKAKEQGVLLFAFGRRTVRAVTHLDVTRAQCERAAEVLVRIAEG